MATAAFADDEMSALLYNRATGSSDTDRYNGRNTTGNEGAIYDSEDPANDWDGMVRNGRVRDTDGDLKDGENALYGHYGVKVDY